jgi:hypothetical protein
MAQVPCAARDTGVPHKPAVCVTERVHSKLLLASSGRDGVLVGFVDGLTPVVLDVLPIVPIIPVRSIDLPELDAGFRSGQEGVLSTGLSPLGLQVIDWDSIDTKSIEIRETYPLELVRLRPFRVPLTDTNLSEVDHFLSSLDAARVVEAKDTCNRCGIDGDHFGKAEHLLCMPSLPAESCPPHVCISSGGTHGTKLQSWTSLCVDTGFLVQITGENAGNPLRSVPDTARGLISRMRMLAASKRYGPSHSFSSFVFWPDELAFPVVMVYPVKDGIWDDEDDALVWRRAMQAALGLDASRPRLRIANAVRFDTRDPSRGVDNDKMLCNVHEGLSWSHRSSQSKSGGWTSHVVEGRYCYYHYNQDGEDDAGWGCAYRSLQTICSWMRNEGYTSRCPPTLREIQAALVSVGDKGEDFIGSKQWIGAVELGFVLDLLYKVTCKILTISDGKDLPSIIPELVDHFDGQGSPVMIGGGVLAYTLLGVDYNDETGHCAFLILDPHYKGEDNLSKIQGGSWVSWKKPGERATAGGDLFVAGAHYNILCPQRPKII